MNETQEVTVKLTTIIKQEDDISQNFIENTGTISETDDRVILNFLDETEEGTFVIRFDLLKSGEVLLNRQSMDRQNMSDFYFKDQEQKEVLYKTTYGTMNLLSETKYIQAELAEDLLQGQVEIEYLLFEQKQLVGEYKLQLIFSA